MMGLCDRAPELFFLVFDELVADDFESFALSCKALYSHCKPRHCKHARLKKLYDAPIQGE